MWENTEFTRQVRIKQKQLKYLKENKKNISIARFLDKIIDFYKNEKDKV